MTDFIVSVHREIPEAIVLTAAVVVALGVIWTKVIRPVRDWVREFKQWMHRTGEQLAWVDTQMRPNHGSSLVDKVNTAATKMVDTDEKVDRLTRSVALLLQHDAERDSPGRRYGPDVAVLLGQQDADGHDI